MLPCKGKEYALAASLIHQKCFDCPWSSAEFETLLQLPTSLLWMNDRGLLLCSRVFDEMEILTIGVLPEYRRQGLALQLLRDMMDYAQKNGVKVVFLEVAENNLAAIALYQKLGFVLMGRRQGYYHHGKIDALTYRKQF